MDYRGINQTEVPFPPGETLAKITVNILNDKWYEIKEHFFLDVEIPPAASLMGAYKGTPHSARIEIDPDDDSKYYIICCTRVNTTRTF